MTPEEIKDHIEGQAKAFKELRETLESKLADTAEGKEKIVKIEKDLDKFEDTNQKLVDDQEKKAQEILELKAQIELVERKLYRMPGAGKGTDEDTKAQYKEMKHFIATGNKNNADIMEYKFLRTDNDEDGGFLVPDAPLQAIIKKITETSDMRSISRVMTTVNNDVPFPVRNSNITVAFVGQGETDSLTNQKYGLKRLFLHKLQATIPVTMEELQDAGVNIETEITSDVAEEIASFEGGTFINGTGANEPQGILQDTDVERVNSEIADSFTGDNIIDLHAELKTGYRDPMSLLTRRTLAFIRKLKDGQGQYLLIPGVSGGLIEGLPNTINGFRYKEMPDMPEIAAEAEVIAFGEFRRAFVIVDKLGMTVIRDPFSRKREGIVEITVFKRVGSGVVLADAIKILKLTVT